MRAILIILALTAFGFVWWLVTKGNITLPTTPPQNNENTTSEQWTSLSTLELDQLKHQIKMEEEIKQLKEEIKKLSSQSIHSIPQNNWEWHTTTDEEVKMDDIIPISAKFLWKILPVIELTQTENNGIFDLRIFDTTNYTTYKDEKFWITVVASMLPYDNFLKNFQAVDKDIYSVNITKTFPFDTFYVNPAKTDSIVRIVMKVEAQTLLISLPKSKFNTLKELILKVK